jgi:transcriptional regulator with XRE-family HTH domain
MLPSEAELSRRQRRQSWWLLVARLSSGRTQADAARAIGIVGSSYGDFERGVTAPSTRQLVLLAALFDVPIQMLIDPPFTDEERLEKRTGRVSQRTRIEVSIDDDLAEAQ